MLASLAFLFTLSIVGQPGLIARGGDPARGVLVNRTAGLRPFDPPDPSRPTVVFVHGINPASQLVHFTMGQSLGEAIGRGHGSSGFNVLEWDWNAATVVGLRARANDEAAVAQGPLLAGAVLQAGIDPARLHLVGHSAGGMVAASAAQSIGGRTGVGPAHLTLLDPARCYHRIIFDRLAAGSAAARVENYWVPGPSAYGKSVPHVGVLNVRVDARTPWVGLVSPTRSGHFDVVRWYVATAEDPGRRDGFGASLLHRR